MLKNDYLLAKIGVDTAENEPRKERWTAACVGLLLGAAADANAEVEDYRHGGTALLLAARSLALRFQK